MGDLNPIKRELYNRSSPSEIECLKENISTQAARSRSIFYDFLKKAGLTTSSAETYFNEIKKNLNFKIARVLSPSVLMTTYEKILQKSLSNPRHSKKNWNEEEFLFLTSIITYYCIIYDLDCGALVSSFNSKRFHFSHQYREMNHGNIWLHCILESVEIN